MLIIQKVEKIKVQRRKHDGRLKEKKKKASNSALKTKIYTIKSVRLVKY